MKILLFLLLVLCWSADAQNDSYFVSLSVNNIDLQLKGYYVEKVINAQTEDTIIGFVQTGAWNKKQSASFKTSIESEILVLLQDALPRPQSSIPLIIRINKIFICEINTSSAQLAFAYLHLSFIRREGHQYFHMFDAGTTIKSGGMDVTHSHATNINLAFENCFSDFANAIKANQIYNKEIPESELTNNSLSNPGIFPIFQVRTIPKGVFHTFYDFRDCRIDTSVAFKVHYHKSRHDTNVIKANLSYPMLDVPKPVWGFSDGNNIFMKIDKNYYLLQKSNNDFISHIGYKDMSEDAAPAVIGGMLGGALGATIGLLIADASIPTQKAGYHEATWEGPFKVDFCNGELAPVNPPNILKIQSKIIFFLSRGTRADASVCLYINNEYHVTLSRGKYYELTLSSKIKDVPVKFFTDSGVKHEESFPAKLFNKEIYLIHVKGRSKITVDHLTGEVRSDIENDLTSENKTVRSVKLNPSPCTGNQP